MKVMGVDCSTKVVAIFEIQNKKGSVTEIRPDAKDTASRINIMFLELVEFFKRHRPKMVYIENSPYLQNIKVTLQIHSVVDSVRFACVLNGIPSQTVEVTSWKKVCCGNGRADKATIMQWAKLRWGADLITNQDIADASGVAHFGAIALGL